MSERTYDLAQELNIHYYACGHHATERYGVQALAAHLEQEFGVEHRFIDTNNPIYDVLDRLSRSTQQSLISWAERRNLPGQEHVW